MTGEMSKLLDDGANIYGIAGRCSEVFPKVVGKIICLGHSVSYRGQFNLIIKIESIEYSTHTMTIKGKSMTADRNFEDLIRSYSAPECVWVIDNYEEST